MNRRTFMVGAATVAALGGQHRGVDWQALRGQLAGDVLLPGDDGYLGTAHTLPLKQFDAILPEAVVRCATSEDVAEAVRFARRHGIRAVARSGGHSFAGYSTTTGMLIDVGRLNHVAAHDGVVTAQAGAQLVDVHAELDSSGVSVSTGWCPTVGLGGLTLGGGLGFDTRKYGVTSDRLLAADVVVANGDLVRCDSDHHPDLFWALRGGGGGNFGIATQFVYDPVPTGDLTSFMLSWPWSRADRVLDAWQHWAPHTPEEMTPLLNISQSDGAPAVTVAGARLGGPAGVEDQLDRLAGAVGSAPDSQSVSTLPSRQAMMQWFDCEQLSQEQCHLVGQNPRAELPRFAFSAARGNFFDRTMSVDAVAAVLRAFEHRWSSGRSGSLDVQALGGQCNRVSPTATAFVHRDSLYYAGFSASFDKESSPAAEREAYAWLDNCWATALPFSSGHSYQNYLDPRLTDWQNSYYGVNYPRLAAVKRAYDPDRFFEFPQAIR